MNTFAAAFRTALRPLSHSNPLRPFQQVKSFSSGSRRLAEQPQASRPDIGASSLFDNVAVEAAAATEGVAEKAAVKEYRWASANMPTSPRKLNMLARQIRNMPVDEAIKQMEFSPKRTAKKILHNLAFARKLAKEQHGMENPIVAQAWVGKGRYLQRVKPHGRGQFGIMHHKQAHIKFLLKDSAEAALETADQSARRNIRGWKESKKVWTPLKEDKPIYNPKAFYNW
ncbi:ribosomal protein L22/L17 [Dichotomocladium elegans]|nr:ribosomal protein L22/L17 [Dichotomocladium elegans]